MNKQSRIHATVGGEYGECRVQSDGQNEGRRDGYQVGDKNRIGALYLEPALSCLFFL